MDEFLDDADDSRVKRVSAAGYSLAWRKRPRPLPGSELCRTVGASKVDIQGRYMRYKSLQHNFEASSKASLFSMLSGLCENRLLPV
jgi:hypothetical protein